MKVVRVEQTPNPNAIKLMVDGKLIPAGSRSYESPTEAAGDQLAQELFSIPAIRTVFFMPSFVTVSKDPGADWAALEPRLTEIIERSAGAEALAAAAGGTVASDDAAMLRKIEEIMETRVRPALAGDGGGLELLGLDNYVLTIRYQGACGSCPSAIAGTLRAIEHMLRVDVDPALSVVAG